MNIQEELIISQYQPVVGRPERTRQGYFNIGFKSTDARISFSFVRRFTIWGVFKVSRMNVREEGER